MAGSEADLIPSLRQIVQLLILSGLSVLLVDRLFLHNPATRRIFALGCALLVLGFPLAWLMPTLVVPVPMASPPQWLPDASVPALLMVILLVSGLLLAMQTVGAALRLQLRYANLVECSDPRLLHCLISMAGNVHGGKVPALKLVSGAGPASGTLVADVILLPMHATSWSESTLRAVFSHELTHIKRHDDQWLLVMRVLTRFYWWMPWLKNLELRASESIEESCDDLASQLHPQDECYLTGVLVVARDHVQPPRPSVFAGMLASGRGHLLHRVQRFSGCRVLETEVGSVYWSCIGMLVIVLVVAGVKPVPIAERSLAMTTSLLWLPLQTGPVAQPKVELSVVPLSADPVLRTRLAGVGSFAAPMYPGIALNEGTQGEVLLQFDLAADGTVVRPVLMNSVAPELDSAALRAVSGMRYPPLHSVSSPSVLEQVSARSPLPVGRQMEARIRFLLNRYP